MTKERGNWVKALVYFFILLCSLITQIARAESANASEKTYEQALESIENNDIPQAIAHLEFLHQQDPRHAGALLDLAYLYCHAGQRLKMIRMLSTLESEFSPPPKILHLIQQLRQRSCVVTRGNTKWAVATSLGYDSNFNQGSRVNSLSIGSDLYLTNVILTDDFLPKSSYFFRVSAQVYRELDNENYFYGRFSAQNYTSTSDFDLSTFSSGFGHTVSSENWQGSADIKVILRTLGGSLYQESFSSNIQLLAFAPYPDRSLFGLEMEAAYSRYPDRPAFNNVEMAFFVPYILRFGKEARARVLAGWTFDKALENRPGGNRSGPILAAETVFPLAGGWTGYMAWQARFLDTDLPYSPPLFPAVRNQRQQFFSVSAERKVGDSQSIRVEYQYTNNNDTIPIYGFNNNSVIFSWIIEGGK
jgi:hypothetical protein